ncbi:MAG: UDP-glucose 4-epimerase GalE [bacterium]|tara:strand:- start:26 stop:1012 length:987 start_codon:yes stop_codon:yes gene_type:complete
MNTSTPDILVVGGAGYIGSHVVKALRDAGRQPVVFDNLSTGLRENLFPEIPFIHGDLLIPEQVRAAMRGIRSVIHLAALKAAGDSMLEPERYALHNLNGTVNLLHAAGTAGVRHFVFSSSAAVYGEPQYLPLDENHPTEPANFYGQTKLQIEMLLSWFSRLRNMRYAGLRYFNAAGYDPDGEVRGLEKEPNNLLPLVLETLLGWRENLEVYGTDYDTEDGSCIRDYIHVSDLADAHLRALSFLEEQDEDLVLNLGTSKGISVLEILDAARKVSGMDLPVIHSDRRPGDPAVVLASAEKAERLLEWSPAFSDVETILKTMLAAYRSHHR